MAAPPPDPQNDELVDFFLSETGDTLHFIVEYTSDDWRFRYVREGERPRITNLFDKVDEFLDQFRRCAQRNAQWERLFEVGEFYCTLHLFDEQVLMHFSKPEGHGIIFGYAPRAASNLTDFVQFTLPYIREYALEDFADTPSW